MIQKIAIIAGSVFVATITATTRADYWTATTGTTHAAVADYFSTFVYSHLWNYDLTNTLASDIKGNDFIKISGPSSLTLSSGATASGYNAQAWINGSSEYGVLHSSAQASGSVNLFNAGAKSTGECKSQFFDSVTITSNTLAVGSPVSFNLTMTLDSDVSDPENNAYQWNLVYKKPGTQAVLNTMLTCTGGKSFENINIMLTDGDGAIIPKLTTRTQTITVNAYVGSQFNFSVYLDTIAAGCTGLGVLNDQWAWITAYNNYSNAINTGIVNLDMITPGAQLTTDSGIDYSTPVPEPTSLGLLMLGSVLLMKRK